MEKSLAAVEPNCDAKASHHLALLHELQIALESANASLTAVRMDRFQQDVTHIEGLTHSLLRILREPSSQLNFAGFEALPSAYRRVSRVNFLTAALLRRALRTSSLLAALYLASGVTRPADGCSLSAKV